MRRVQFIAAWSQIPTRESRVLFLPLEQGGDSHLPLNIVQSALLTSQRGRPRLPQAGKHIMLSLLKAAHKLLIKESFENQRETWPNSFNYSLCSSVVILQRAVLESLGIFFSQSCWAFILSIIIRHSSCLLRFFFALPQNATKCKLR